MNVTTQLLNYLEEGRKMPGGRAKWFGFGSGSQTFSGAVKIQSCSSSHWEVPAGQTEPLWFSFKMPLLIGN